MVLGGLDRGREGKGVGNCELTADCVRGILWSVGREGKGVGNCVLIADCVRGFE